MARSKKESNLVSVSFDPEVIGCTLNDTCIYGIQVEAKGEKLVGETNAESAKALVDAGKAE
jgi:hypothetical protein